METRPTRDASHWVAIVLAALSTVLALALAVAAVYIFAPDVLQRVGLIRQATPTTEPVVPSPTAPIPSPMPTSGPSITPQPTPLASPSANPIAPGEFDELLDQAEALTRRSKFDEAIAIYQHLTEASPDDARPQTGWAWALILDDQSENALAHAEKAVGLDSTDAQATTALARVLIETGSYARAFAQALTAVQLEADSSTAHAVLAEAYLVTGQPQLAVDEADLALVLNIGDAEAHRIRGWIYNKVDDDMGRAVSELQAAAGIEPELWLRRHELGVVLLEAQNYSTAILAFQDALAIRPKARTYSAIGEAYYLADQPDQARAALLQATLAGAEDANTYALLAATYGRLGQCDNADKAANKALALEPNNPLALQAKEDCQVARVTPAPTPSAGAATVTPTATPQPTKPPSRAAALSGRIAFPVWNAQTGKYDTYIAAAKDGSGHLVAEQMHQPALSPDGAWLAVNGERSGYEELFIIRPDGSGLQAITPFLEDGQASWSSDGKRLVLGSTRHGDKEWRIYILDAVPIGGGKVEGRPLNFGPDDIRGRQPTWTGDGRIVYQGCHMDSAAGQCQGLGLFVISEAAGPHTPSQLTEEPSDTNPSIFRGKIAFMSVRDGDWEIYTLNLDGTGLRQLTENGAQDGLPVWSVDGKSIAYATNQGGSWAIWAMNADGSSPRKLFDIGGGGLSSDWEQEQISWGP